MKRYYDSHLKLLFRNRLTICEFVYEILCTFSVIVGVIALFNSIFFNFYLNMDNFVAVLLVIISVYLCYVYRHNIGLFIVMIFMAYANYSVAVAVYLDYGISSFLYYQFSKSALSSTLLCVFLFELCILLFSGNIVSSPLAIKSKNGAFVKYESNDIIALGSLLLYVLIFVTTFSWQVLGGRGSITSVTEYRIVIAIIGIYYSGNKNFMKWLWTIVIVIVSLIVFASGNRVDAISSMILVGIYWWYDLISYKKFLFIFPFLVILMSIIGVVRGNSLSQISLDDFLVEFYTNKFTWDTAYFAYTPSVAIVDITDELNFSITNELFWKELVYIFAGSNTNYEGMIYYTLKSFSHYGGCFTPAYFYVWCSYFSPLIVAALFLIYMNFYYATSKKTLTNFFDKIKYLMSIYMISNVSRWYCYGPNGLLRNMFVLSIVFFLVHSIDTLLLRRKKG